MAIKECVVCGGSFDAIRAHARLCHPCRHAMKVERTRAWRMENKNDLNERKREKYRTNPEVEKKKAALYRERNPEKHRESVRISREKYGDIYRAREREARRNESPQKREARRLRNEAFSMKRTAAYNLIKQIEKEGLSALL